MVNVIRFRFSDRLIKTYLKFRNRATMFLSNGSRAQTSNEINIDGICKLDQAIASLTSILILIRGPDCGFMDIMDAVLGHEIKNKNIGMCASLFLCASEEKNNAFYKKRGDSQFLCELQTEWIHSMFNIVYTTMNVRRCVILSDSPRFTYKRDPKWELNIEQ